MTGRFFPSLLVLAAAAISNAGGGPRLMRDVQQHLDLARRCATIGEAVEALAHAAVVTPERALRVRVDCSNIAQSDQGPYRNALAGAFRMWESALGQRVFEVTEGSQSDLVIHFQPNVSDKGIEVCGHSQWTRGVLNPTNGPTVIFTADVQVRMYRPTGEPLTFEQLRACAAHELGHVLGLDDCPDSSGLMGRMDFNHPALTIRPDEVEALVHARDEMFRLRRSFGVQSFKFNR